ncbi:M56 family metallopeptidase [Chitinophaga sp. HK235]|uniref:M56 family metallopeptidase n=1 Tax=Chitinophaga sp. HK235 TaxID=2952571 RepID=UPI001BA44A27|nr:M56 family metallopeptidase [Chitinophaga sp. HK235]
MLLLIYSAKVILCSALLYTYYHLALRNNRFHHWNRYYLLLITVVSLITPLVKIPLPAGGQTVPATVVTYTSKMITLRETVVTPAADPSFYLRTGVIVIYVLIAFFLLCRLLVSIHRIRQLVRSSEIQPIPPYHFARHHKVTAPFSFFRYIFWDLHSSLDSPSGKQMLQHELVHVREKHSTDKILMEVITAICWFNPFFHLIKRELTLVHEFIADQKAAGEEVAGYAENILRMTFESNQFSITNNFFHPPIKRRILMLTQFRQPRFSYLRRILVLPLAALIFCSLAFVADKRPSAIRALVPPGTLPGLMAENIPVADTAPASKNKSTVQLLATRPSFPGGEDSMAAYLSRNVRYPKEAARKGTQGMVTIEFLVNEQGQVTNAKIKGNKILGDGLEEEALRVVKAMPRWTPATYKGKKEAVRQALPIRFSVTGDQPVSIVQPAVYTFVEHPPTYVGGEEALTRYLSNSIHYPREAQENNVSGTILVQFVVDSTGHLKDLKTVGTKKGYGLEEEALRVITAMPQWNPGMHRNKKVAVQFNLPIRFTLQY